MPRPIIAGRDMESSPLDPLPFKEEVMSATFYQVKYGEHLIEIIPVWKHTPFSWDDKAPYKMKFIVDDYTHLTRRLLPIPMKSYSRARYKECYYIWYSGINDIVGLIHYKEDGIVLTLKKGTDSCVSTIEGNTKIEDLAVTLTDAWYDWDGNNGKV